MRITLKSGDVEHYTGEKGFERKTRKRLTTPVIRTTGTNKSTIRNILDLLLPILPVDLPPRLLKIFSRLHRRQ